MLKSPKIDMKEYTRRLGPEAVPSHVFKTTCKEMGLHTYITALKELIQAVSKPLHIFEGSFHGSDDELQREYRPRPLEDTQHLFTETDVTLPSCVAGSPDTEPPAGNTLSRSPGRLRLPSSSRQPTSPGDLDKICQEMMTIYEQLKAERVSQQKWEREVAERERRLEERERSLGEREEALGRLGTIEEELNSCILSVQQTHQREVRQMRELLRERATENKRLNSSFTAIKERNSSMKTQLKELGERNGKLESQCKRAHARLENLQGPRRPCSPPPLLALLLNWLLEAPTFSSVAPHPHSVPTDPHRECLPPEVRLTDRCLQMLPLLADQLQQTALLSEDPLLLLGVLRLVYWALGHLDASSQVALSSTLRRIGAQVSATPPPRDHGDLDDGRGGHGVLRGYRGGGDDDDDSGRTGSALYRSPCPHTRILSVLVVLHTVTQADLLAQALGSLSSQLRCEGSRGLFLQYGGLAVLLGVLRASSQAALHVPIGILVQLSAPSCFLDPFLEACSCAAFFSTVSQLLQPLGLDLPSLENLSILLQKLSAIRKNRGLFERSSLHLLLLREVHRATRPPTGDFLRLNLSSILLNLACDHDEDTYADDVEARSSL